MEDIISKIRHLITEDDAEAALQLLSSLLHQDKLLDEVILLSARKNRVEKEVREGVIDYINANLTKNQVNKSILDICNKIAVFYSLPYSEKNYLDKLISDCEFIKLALIDRSLLDSSLKDKPRQDGAKTLRKVKVSEVFTPLKLKFDNIAITQKIGDDLGYNIDYSDEDAEKLYRLEAVEAIAAVEKEPTSETPDVAKPNCLIILGRPGGGKSTLLNHLTGQLAKKRLFGNFDDKQKMPHWKPEKRPLIVRITLREFAAWLPDSIPSIIIENLVWDYLKYRDEEYYPLLKKELIEKGGIVFFDGLDEVSASDEQNKRKVVIHAIVKFAGFQPRYGIIITCREYLFLERNQTNESLSLLDDQKFPIARLALFHKKEIRAFVRNWYKLLGDYNGWDSRKSAQMAEALVREIDEIPHLKKLAEYPLLLTLMANVHYLDGSLPERRADLYDRNLMLQLIYWDNPELDEELAKSEFLKKYKVPKGIMRDILAEVAFIVHERQGKNNGSTESSGIISASAINIKLENSLTNPKEKDKENVQYFLERLKKNLGPDYLARIPYIAKAFTKYLEDRAGLLQFRGKNEDEIDTYALSHRTFQEYLAAEHILNQPNFEEMLKERVFADLSWWREVFLLAVGICIPDRFDNFVALIDSIMPESIEEGDKVQHLDRVLLAAQALTENKVEEAFQKRNYTRTLNDVRTWLLHALRADNELSPLDRTAVGVSLAHLGDPRKEVTSLDHMTFCFVPAGPYFKSSEEEHRHKHSIFSQESIVGAFWISRFQVSNAQYQEFIDAGGYGEQAFWRENVNWIPGKYDGRNAPEQLGSPFDLPNHPVVGISWFEAMAFTRWLTRKWHNENVLPPGYIVRLPIEQEWEKAARGGINVPEKPLVMPVPHIKPECSCSEVKNTNPHRIYPWGGQETDPNRMNFGESNVGCTSPLGCYPGGASPCGCEDMSGNVNEWCYGKYNGVTSEGDAMIFIRGGSYSHLADSCCLTHQAQKKWNVTMNSIGFRLVIASQNFG